MKVAVVSVVGKYRSGKSFLLDFFLRYLRFYDEGRDGSLNTEHRDVSAMSNGQSEWIQREVPLEGSANNTQGDDADEGTRSGFSWRHGDARMTTGIWMWSRPYFLTMPTQDSSSERVAVLLVDTQGMFDQQAGQMLTSCIFALSALMSSVQVYNVKAPLGEDNLQHLAVFSEYARIAHDDEDEAAAGANPTLRRTHSTNDLPRNTVQCNPDAPFQHVAFLLRDDGNIGTWEDYAPPEYDTHNEQRLHHVLNAGNTEDIRETRDQIQRCYRRLSCSSLPYPGTSVASKRSYDGALTEVDDFFLLLVEKFVVELFRHHVEPKKVHGMEVSARDLRRFMVVFGKLFQSADAVPEAQSLLRATAQANNRNAFDKALSTYRSYMDSHVEQSRSCLADDALQGEHDSAKRDALTLFDKRAAFGDQREIARFRERLVNTMDQSIEYYVDANGRKDIFNRVEVYAILLVGAIGGIFTSSFFSLTCSPWFRACSHISSVGGLVSSACFLLLLLLGIRHGRRMFNQLTKVAAPFPILQEMVTRTVGADAPPPTKSWGGGRTGGTARAAGGVDDQPVPTAGSGESTLRRRHGGVEE